MTETDIYTLKVDKGDGKLIWLKEQGKISGFTRVKSLRNFMKNRQYSFRRMVVFKNGEEHQLDH